MATPTVVGTTSSPFSSASTNTITINKPSGVQDGDYLVAFLRSQSAGATADWASSGWTRISAAFAANQGGARLVGIYALPVPTASSLTATSFTFTFTGTAGRVIGTIALVRGVDLSAPVAANNGFYSGNTITNGSRINSYNNPAGINSLAFGMFAGELVAGNTNAITVTSSAATTVIYSNDTANDGTTGTAGSRTALTVLTYAGVTTLPQVDVTWGAIAGPGSEGVALKGLTSNAPPVAAFTFGVSGLVLSVDASSSSDSDGTVAGYSWEYGDSSTGTGVTATHTYASAGTYTIKLTVTDNNGATGSTTHSVTVGNSNSTPPSRLGYSFLNPSTSNTMVLDPSTVTGGTAIATGDWVIAAFALFSATVTFTPPAGWTALKQYATVGTLGYAVYGRIRQSTDTTYTFTVDSNGNVAAAALMWGAGADPMISNWVVGSSTNRTVNNQNTAASITTSADHSLLLGFSFERTTAAESAISSISGANEWFFMPQVSTSQIQTLDVGYVADVTPIGATAVMTWNYPNTQATNGVGFQISIPPTPVNNNISVGYPGVLRTSGGTNYNGKLFYWDGSAAHDFTTTLTKKFAPVTVSQFLAAKNAPWFAAHRGFSYSYPEETMYSYRGATDWGVKAIEISVQKSSDGTFWCFHDATTNRTTGVSGTISSMTDAQISVLNNLGSTAANNTSQPARPVAKLVDVLNQFAATHVIVIEDKTYANTTAMLNLMDSYGTSGRPANEIFIWKVASSSSKTSFFDPATARGYHRWAYIFDASMSSEFPALPASGKADMIGMDYASSDATLSSAIAQCIANGVMPTGHIVNSVAQRDRLIGLGMKGIMISNKDVVPPWYNVWPA